jgi:hypothetical protein
LGILPIGALIVAGMISVGCHHGGQYVYVNVGAAVMPPSPVPALPPLPLTRPETATSSRFTLPAQPEVTDEPISGTGAAKVQASVAANRERTFKLIVRRLQEAYAREAANLRAQKLAEFEPVHTALISQALTMVSKAYVAYANAAGPKIARLAVNAGFPDPDPKGRRKPNGLEGLDTLAYQNAQKMREDLATLKANFKRYSETTLRNADADADAKLTNLLSEVARQVGDVDARAQEVAKREVSQAQAQLGPLLADKPPTPLPATPGSSVVIASSAQPAITLPAGKGTFPSADDDLNRVKQDLDIWLSVNNYIQQPKGRARDATAEFINWRHRFRQEPSASP